PAPVIAHVEGAYVQICEAADVETTSGDSAKLERLVSEKLKDKKNGPKIPKELRKVRAVCDFQFGMGANEHLFEGPPVVKGFQVYDEKEKLVATIDRSSGFLALSLRGAERLSSFGRYIVEVSFNPETNSIFCSGIEGADPLIRPWDETIVKYRGEVVGVGKAVLSGEEMERAKKGLGVTLRHRRR
ncbi:MAG: PUA domain-containing protein, partial [Candidatus Hydrothermarchaeales archaeon]